MASWFQQLIAGLPKNDYAAIRCLFISQEDGYARKDLSMLSTIKITHTDNYADIKRFCEHWHQQIEAKFGLLLKRQHHVTNIVSARAQGMVPRYFSARLLLITETGMFLFAKLVTWNLYEQISRADFEKEIDEEKLPDNINKAYVKGRMRNIADTL